MEQGEKDGFYILEWEELRDIAITGYCKMAYSKNGVKPRPHRSMHCAALVSGRNRETHTRPKNACAINVLLKRATEQASNITTLLDGEPALSYPSLLYWRGLSSASVLCFLHQYFYRTLLVLELIPLRSLKVSLLAVRSTIEFDIIHGGNQIEAGAFDANPAKSGPRGDSAHRSRPGLPSPAVPAGGARA